MNGKQASFLSGGEFPVPVVQGGANVGAVTIQFREFGVRLNFLPTITPRGTIRLQVAPEVSSLDYANGIEYPGLHRPRYRDAQSSNRGRAGERSELCHRRPAGQPVQRDAGQDSRHRQYSDSGQALPEPRTHKSNSELLVMVTPEIVRPIPDGQPQPRCPDGEAVHEGTLKEAPRTPGIDVTGPVPVKPERETLPVEELQELQKKEQGPVTGSSQPTLLLPLMMNPAGGTANPAPAGAGRRLR